MYISSMCQEVNGTLELLTGWRYGFISFDFQMKLLLFQCVSEVARNLQIKLSRYMDVTFYLLPLQLKPLNLDILYLFSC